MKFTNYFLHAKQRKGKILKWNGMPKFFGSRNINVHKLMV